MRREGAREISRGEGWRTKTQKIVKVGGMRSEVGTEQKKHSSAY